MEVDRRRQQWLDIQARFQQRLPEIANKTVKFDGSKGGARTFIRRHERAAVSARLTPEEKLRLLFQQTDYPVNRWLMNVIITPTLHLSMAQITDVCVYAIYDLFIAEWEIPEE